MMIKISLSLTHTHICKHTHGVQEVPVCEIDKGALPFGRYSFTPGHTVEVSRPWPASTSRLPFPGSPYSEINPNKHIQQMCGKRTY